MMPSGAGSSASVKINPTVTTVKPTIHTANIGVTNVRTPTVTTPRTPTVHVSTITVRTPVVRTPTVSTPSVRTPTVRINVPTVRTPTISDVRLKRDIVELGVMDNGLHLYKYRYIGNPEIYVGVMAQEVALKDSDAVTLGSDGYLRVDYQRLGMRLMTYGEWQRRPNRP